MAVIKNFKINVNDVVVAYNLNADIIVDVMSICNTSVAPITLSVYKRILLPLADYYIIKQITLGVNCTFVYEALRIQKNCELHITSLDGTADVSISHT